MKTSKYLLLLSGMLLISGCAYQHDYMYYQPNKARIENKTSQNISLMVCSNVTAFSVTSLKKSKIQIVADPTSEINLPSDSRHEVKQDATGGFDYVYLDEVNYVNFQIESSSFHLIKLCFNEATKTNLLISKSDSCPADLIEQTSPSFCE